MSTRRHTPSAPSRAPRALELAVMSLSLAVIAARVVTHLAGLDRYAALLAGGVPDGAWDPSRAPTWCVLVVLLQLSAWTVAPVALLTALGAWALRVSGDRARATTADP